MRSVYFFLLLFTCFSLNAQNIHWGKVINNSWNDYIYDMQVDKDSNLVICGQFGGTVDFDPGPDTANLTAAGSGGTDLFLAKYDSAGNYLWAHAFGTAFFYDEGDRIAIDSAGNIFFTGMFGSTVDFDPDPVNTAAISSPGSNRSRFLAKYDATGNFLAVKHTGNAVGSLPSSQDGQSGLGCDADGNIYMSGFYGTSLTIAPGNTLSVSGLSDNYFAKFDPQLNLIWAHRIGSTGTEYSQGMYVYPSGKIIDLGSFNNTVDFDPGPGTVNLTQTGSGQDGYFALFDSSGNFISVHHLKSGSSATPIAALADSRQNIIITGSCAGTMDADPGVDTAYIGTGFNDQAFVAAYDSVGNYRWAFAFGDVNAFNAIRYAAIDSSDNIYVAGNYNPMVDVDPGPDTAVFGDKYGAYITSYDTAGNFRTGFLYQEAKIRMAGNDIYATGGFYGLVDFDPGPQVFNLQSDTANASWYLLRMHLCGEFAASPGSISHGPACAGDTAQLSVSNGGPQYLWQVPQGFTAVGSLTDSVLIVVTDSASSQGTFLVQSTGGCLNSPFVFASINVSQPVIPFITLQNDTLFTSTPAESYQWFVDGTLIPGAIDSIYIPDSSGAYSVMITGVNGCVSLSAAFNYVVTVTASAGHEPFYIYPNPCSDVVHFSRPLQELKLTDVYGRIIARFNEKTSSIFVAGLAEGIYYLHSKNVLEKVIVHH